MMWDLTVIIGFLATCMQEETVKDNVAKYFLKEIKTGKIF